MPDAAITSENILEKLCFMRYGAGIKDHNESFKGELYAFLRKKHVKDIRRQTIKYWLDDRKSLPKRVRALRFLYDYFSATVTREALTQPGQKQVYDQVVTFFKRHGGSVSGIAEKENPATMSLSNNRRVMVDIAQQTDSLRTATATLSGVYRLFHMQLDDNSEFPVTSEVLEVFERGRELRFRLFNLLGDAGISIISGIVMVVGRTIWLIGSSNVGTPRMRTLALRHIEASEARYNNLRWGIMMTDIPKPSSPDPVACRVVLWKERMPVKDRVEYAQVHVRHVSKEETEREPLKSLMRVIHNNITALSDGHSPNPPLKAGSPIMDEPLKVNQVTIELIADKIAAVL